MKKITTKLTAILLSLVFLFSGSFALIVHADNNLDANTYSASYDEDVIYAYEDEYVPGGYFYFKARYIDTPNTADAVLAVWALQDYPQNVLDEIDYQYDNFYDGANRLSPATVMYNCHSYAWYSQDVYTNEYWIDNPSAFYEDYSYCTVSTPREGDIICYFDDMGTANENDDTNRHSGIVTSVLSGLSNNECGNSDLVIVTSKWGKAGLYSHNGYECPYTSYAYGNADYVKYYRDSHDYSYYNNGSNHSIICEECDYVSATESHKITHSPYNNEKHKDICVCGLQSFSPHIIEPTTGKIGTCMICGASVDLRGSGSGTIMPWGSNNGISSIDTLNSEVQYITENGTYILSNGAIILSENDYVLYLSGELDLSELIYSDCCTE